MKKTFGTKGIKNYEIEKKLIFIGIAIVGYLIYFLLYPRVDNNNEYRGAIFLLSWAGIILGGFILYSWKKYTGMYFSPYTIFILFFFLFNYGQCLMWALGIHAPGEIGTGSLYAGWGRAYDADIVKVQLLTLVGILMFHCGSMMCIKNNNKKQLYIQEDTQTLNNMLYVCFIASVVIFPITLYCSYEDLRIAQVHGYRALYYSEYAKSGSALFDIISKMFFPCIIGMLVGSRFDKKIRIYTYSIFGIYLVVNMLSGDRGSWVYKILILVWISHFCYKSIDIKKCLYYLIVGGISLYIIDVMVELRNIGINYDNVKQALSIQNSPIISTVFEMGTSMKPAIILQKYGWDIWPYNNTYLLSFFAIISTRFLGLINVPFETIGSWFSQTYLGISYGAGFSIIAEALLNYGPYIAPFILFILGKFITSLIYIDKKLNYKINPLKLFFVVCTLNSFLTLTRGYLHYQLKDWFYGTLVIWSILCILKHFKIKIK